MTASRLGKDDWIKAGFKALTERGPDALKAEVLARRIGATKGSFYWHFRDVAAFKLAMLDYWQEAAFSTIETQLAGLDAPERLSRLISMTMQPVDPRLGGSAVETAIRAWASSDRVVAATLARMDADRLAYLSELFLELGRGDPLAPRMFYACLIGLEELGARDGLSGEAHLRALASSLGIGVAKPD